MDNEIIFLKYMDHQLKDDEVREVEKIIAEDPAQKRIFDTLKQKRQATLDALEFLNPDEDIVIPAFEPPNNKSDKVYFKPIIWHYAAAAILVLLLPLSFWWYCADEPELQLMEQTELANIEKPVINTEELDYYISPNRCWNQRQLLWTVIDLND